MKRTILVVDDDEKLVDVIRLYLQREAYQVLIAYDGLSALSLARQQHPDLIILDWLLPHLDGLDLCRILRAEASVPIILLTARSTEEDTLLGLTQGADDYVTKPFRPRELVARVQAVLRRTAHETEKTSLQLHAGELVLDLLAHEAWLQGRCVALTPTEFTLLATLMREPGRAFRREELVRLVFGSSYEGLERTIDVHLMNVRKKIESHPETPQYVQTVYGVGYKFQQENRHGSA
ncbi:MAG: response regulator transcription factor [Ktedonobacteraceae bacterium]|nr:response regulator transcription factor [Ktedonobacteraceae bacterium]